MLLGLVSAVGFGVIDTITTYAARRIGSIETVFLGLSVGSIAPEAFLFVAGLDVSTDID